MPIAEIVPISRMRSYTAMIMTFMTLIRTMETSMILMNTVSRSIMLAILRTATAPPRYALQVRPPPPLPAGHAGSPGFPAAAGSARQLLRQLRVDRSSCAGFLRRMAISLISGSFILSRSRASSMWM